MTIEVRVTALLKVAHFVIITPGRCGLYSTTQELVTNLRLQGVDSRMVDPLPDTNPVNFKGKEDRGALVADLKWAEGADILVSHSGIGALESKKPFILVVHGRPYHSFLTESVGGGAGIYSYHYRSNKKPNLKAVVTFWPQHVPYLEVMMPDKPIHYVQSTVDLDFWSPGPKRYDFEGKAGGVNIVCTDALRNDVDCYNPLNAYALWARKNKHLNPKLHMFNKPKDMRGWNPLIKRIQDDGNMGMVVGWARGLEHVYRAADATITAHNIDVRTVRESMACGCPVVRINRITDNYALTMALREDREYVRRQAKFLFDPAESAKQFKEILESHK